MFGLTILDLALILTLLSYLIYGLRNGFLVTLGGIAGFAAGAVAAFLSVQLLRGWSGQTQLLVLSSFLMFGCCFASASHLLGARAALRFALIALPIGWFAEQMGSSHGCFFGKYTYTEMAAK